MDSSSSREVGLRARNRRTGLILATIALVFFVAVILKYTLR